MQLIRGIHNIQSADRGCVLTIGNFDGVHFGHQRIIKELVVKAKQLNLVATVMVFEPQPQEVFAKQSSPARLTRLRDKYNLLAELGVQRLLCVNFNQEFANQTASHFIENLLVKRLGTKQLIIGDDFRFGKNRLGDFAMLNEYGKRLSFNVTDTASYKMSNCRISSTEVRKALEHDELKRAESMLGRPYAITGRVVHGEKNGRKFGFPTANVLLKRLVSPVAGVYAVKIDIKSKEESNKPYFGVANIGCRPTLNGIRQQLEVHVFDFDQDLYGKKIEVTMLKKIRSEIKFSSIDALKEQISKDSEQARLFTQCI